MKNFAKKLLTFVAYHANILIVDTVNVTQLPAVMNYQNREWILVRKNF